MKDFELDKTLVDAPELEKDYFTFNIQDIISAVNEHERKQESEAEVQEAKAEPEAAEEVVPEPVVEPEFDAVAVEPEPAAEPESILEPEPEPAEEDIPEPKAAPEPEAPAEPEPEAAPEPEPTVEAEPVELEPTDEAVETDQATQLETASGSITVVPEKQSGGTKKLVIADVILLAVIIISIVVGLVLANSLVDKANAAKKEKITAVQESVQQVDLSESLRAYAAEEVLEGIKVPTYTLEQLYALDLRKKTGFTAEDLKIITTRGLVGCEEAFVEAEEKYGVNSIFLISIASLESAYGTQMFRPNNMFGYGRTGFSSKSECIMTVASGLGNRYLNPSGSLYGGSPTLKGVNKRYAANPQWYYKVGKYMQRYYKELAAAKNGNLEKFE